MKRKELTKMFMMNLKDPFDLLVDRQLFQRCES